MPNEADTCRRFVVPQLQAAGWENDPYRINEQVTFTDGRIIVAGSRSHRRPGKRADYILRYRPDFPIAVVQAKASYATAGAGLQQAKDYAEILGLKFAYATNGHGIVEFDYTTGMEREISAFPTPDELWSRLTLDESITVDAAEQVLAPAYHLSGQSPRYYQEIAINRAVQAVAKGDPGSFQPRPAIPLLTPTRRRRNRSQHALSDRIPPSLGLPQEQNLLLNLWSQKKQIHDLRQPDSRDLADRRLAFSVEQAPSGTGNSFLLPVPKATVYRI